MKTFGNILLLTFCAVSVPVIAAGSNGPLQAGAAKVDITPPLSALPPGDTIRDPLYVRAVVVANGSTCAALVGVDQGGLSTAIVDAAIARAVKATTCPAGNYVISATHTHSGGTGFMGLGGKPDAQQLQDAIVTAITQAKLHLRPARIGFGTTDVYLNVNRDLFENQKWIQGPNLSGPSDKTLSVIEFLGSDDLPIAVYMGYAMHPIDFYLSGVVSADFAGEASRYIERRYGRDVVGIFAQGASGDQNPLYSRPLLKLSGVRSRTPGASDDQIHSTSLWTLMASELNGPERMAKETAIAVKPEEEAAYTLAKTQVSDMVTAMGTIIGEASIETMHTKSNPTDANASIWGGSKTFSCPGRDRVDTSARQGVQQEYKDGAPVEIRVGALRLGDIEIITVNGEVYNEISSRLKSEAPSSKMMMVALANGMAKSGYIYSNEAGSHLTFQVIGSRLKPGCAEDKIIETGLELIRNSRE
jgi:neutral ceramidase